jgi:hypothetical protein
MITAYNTLEFENRGPITVIGYNGVEHSAMHNGEMGLSIYRHLIESAPHMYATLDVIAKILDRLSTSSEEIEAMLAKTEVNKEMLQATLKIQRGVFNDMNDALMAVIHRAEVGKLQYVKECNAEVKSKQNIPKR